jgi:RNA polymerase sigma-70 factor (ECF subfamily)
MNKTGDGIDVLVGAAVAGDRSAQGRLLGSIQPLVVRYCRARVGRHERSHASADDVAQEVLLAVLTALPSYRDQGRPFLAFVYGIAAHKVADAHRAAARNKSEPVPDIPDTPELRDGPEQSALNGELSNQMAQLMNMLPPKHREILVLRVVVGLSAEETAEAVNSTPGAVRVAQHRALTRLRKALQHEELLSSEQPKVELHEPAIHVEAGVIGEESPELELLLERTDNALRTALQQALDPLESLFSVEEQASHRDTPSIDDRTWTPTWRQTDL